MADYEKEVSTRVPVMEKESLSPTRRGSLPAHVAKHTHDADEAMKAFAGHEGEILELDEATNKRLLRRIDIRLMPVSNYVAIHCADVANRLVASVCRLWLELSRQ